MTYSTYVLLPIKRPENAKTRLSPWLSKEERKELVLSMAADVLDALEGIPTVVISPVDLKPLLDDYEFYFLRHLTPGLDSAVRAGNTFAVRQGAEATLFLPADLPLLRRDILTRVLELGENYKVILSPSNRKGIGLLYRRPPEVMRAHFTGKSFVDNLREAQEKGLEVYVYMTPELYIDIDTREDVLKFLEMGDGTRSHEFLIRLAHRFR